MRQNGYFQLEQKEDGIYIKIMPPVEGGMSVSINEVMEYLAFYNIVYDLKILHKAVNCTDQESVVLLNSEQNIAVRETHLIQLSQDKMRALIRFYPPSVGGEFMSEDELRRDFKAKNIRFGICENVISAYFQQRVYCTDLVIAKGQSPRMGSDAKIEYYFNTDGKTKPTLREDGSVDFHKLNTINHCIVGQLLAKLVPADRGDPGINVLGEKIKPRDVKNAHLEFSRNISISEDRTEIRSMVNGHVSLVEGKVFVSDLLELENVDTSTGDVEYEGNILINGNVFSGFSVKATGNIEVKGVVEAAMLESGGSITIVRGMTGMGKGYLKAKGHVVAKFLENATVTAGEYITTESILHSNVQAGIEIDVTGNKGFITGGTAMASSKISVNTLGSPLGASTIVEVGIDPSLRREQANLQKKYRENIKNIQTIEPVLTASIQKRAQGRQLQQDYMDNLHVLAETRQQKMAENKQIVSRLAELEEIVSVGGDPMVLVKGEVFPGTKVCITDVSMFVKNAISYCKFIKLDGEVKMTSM